jgi:acyl dehydratase
MTVGKNDLTVGQEFGAVLVDGLTRTQIVQYAGASGDYNPLHSDEMFARDVAGYPGVFAHGMLTMGITGRLLTDTFGVGSVQRHGVRFVKQVWPGDTLTAVATVTAIVGELVDLDIVTSNQHNEPVVTGSATVRPQAHALTDVEQAAATT